MSPQQLVHFVMQFIVPIAATLIIGVVAICLGLLFIRQAVANAAISSPIIAIGSFFWAVKINTWTPFWVGLLVSILLYKMGSGIYCQHCGGSGQIFRGRCQEDVDYDECSYCNGTGKPN